MVLNKGGGKKDTGHVHREIQGALAYGDAQPSRELDDALNKQVAGWHRESAVRDGCVRQGSFIPKLF